MPGTDERRTEIRVSLPITIWFNQLETMLDYLRGPTLPAGLEVGDKGPELEGRDELERFIKNMDAKLNLIISLLTANIGRKDYKYKGAILDISESGFRLASPVPLVPGQLLEIGLVLPHQPFKTLDVAGEVVWEKDETNQSGSTGRKTVGVRFIDILPQDQDEVVHYIFQKQRQEIRAKKT